MSDSITVEPLTSSLRREAGLESDLAHLAVVHSTGLGRVASVLATTADYSTAYPTARRFAADLGASVLTASSYRPTVVGSDVAAEVASDPDCQPTVTGGAVYPEEFYDPEWIVCEGGCARALPADEAGHARCGSLLVYCSDCQAEHARTCLVCGAA